MLAHRGVNIGIPQADKVMLISWFIRQMNAKLIYQCLA